MVPQGWLKSENLLPAVEATSLEQLIQAVAEKLARSSGFAAPRIAEAFRAATQGEGFALGSGVAIPHTEQEDLVETLACLVTTTRPLTLPTPDGRAPDIFLFILSKPDPHAHLVLLAHWARLAQSKTFLDGLRRASSAEDMLALVQAAELRHSPAPTPVRQAASHDLVLISVSGEKVVDALLIGLVDEGFEEACVIEAQSLREAATREVPLFAGFRDIFGDPGGRRLLLMDVEADRTEALVMSVRRVCEEHRARDVRVSVLPIRLQWASTPASAEADGEAAG